MLKKSEEHVDSALGAWEVVDSTTVRIRLRPRSGLPLTLLMRAGELVDTITLWPETWADEQPREEPLCLYSFVPEEDESH